MDQLVSSRRVLFFLALSFAAAAAFALLLYATPQGLGLNDDSIAYIAGARSLLSGHGYRELWLVSAGYVTHFPPGFPGALAFISLLTGADPLRASRLLNGLLFGLNTFLMGWLALRMTGSRILGLLTAALFILTPGLLRIHSNAMSEPLYVFFTLLAFLLLDVYFASRRRSWVWLAAAGCVIGLAYLTRYAALALLATGIAACLLLHDTWRGRITRSLVLLGGFLPWMAGWAIRNRLVGGSLTNRALGWHPITPENIRLGLRTFSGFLVPVETWQLQLLRVRGFFEIVLIVLALGLLAWVLAVSFRRLLRPAEGAAVQPIALMNALYAFGYFLALAATMTFFDPATKFQLRILAPIFVSLLLLLAYGIAALADRGGRRTALAVGVLILAVSAFGQGSSLAELRRGGQIYANERWFAAPAIAALRQLPPQVEIHTNQPGVIYLYAGRPGALLPEGQPGISQLQAQVREGQAVIAIFKTPGLDPQTAAYYTALGEGLASHKYNGDVIYTAP